MVGLHERNGCLFRWDGRLVRMDGLLVVDHGSNWLAMARCVEYRVLLGFVSHVIGTVDLIQP